MTDRTTTKDGNKKNEPEAMVTSMAKQPVELNQLVNLLKDTHGLSFRYLGHPFLWSIIQHLPSVPRAEDTSMGEM